MEKNDFADLLTKKYQLDNDMLKVIIEAIPANVFFKDTSCRYQMVSHICSVLNGSNEEWSILGKTDYEVQNDPELAQFYYEDDKNIIKMRKGSHYVSEMVFDGNKYYYEITKDPIIDLDGNLIGIVGLVNDITELKKLEEELRILSITDKLTGVYNRNYFEQKMIDIPQCDYSSLSVIMCDTNGLKFLNDNFGHQKGDALLQVTTLLMKEIVGDAGDIMRIGGDEFIIFCVDCSENKCKMLINELKEKEKDCKYLGVPISNAYGYATLTGNDKNLQAAIMDAEKMMYADKALVKADHLKKLAELISHDMDL